MTLRTLIISLALLLPSAATQAALEVGAKAPDFSAPASLAGEAFDFQLAETLERGPVVVYFYPKAFTQGCTVEARLFAEAADEFAEYDASIIGVSADDLETLHKFSVSECSNKFAVAADPEGDVIAAYDAGMTVMPGLASRISYVVAPDGEILYVHQARAPEGHIEQSLEAVKNWAAADNRAE